MKSLTVGIAVLAAVGLSGCTGTTNGVDPQISAQGRFCAFGACLVPQAGIAAAAPVSAPVVVVPQQTPAPPVYAQALPPPVSYNPVPVRTLEK